MHVKGTARRLLVTISGMSAFAVAPLLAAPTAQASLVDLDTCNSNALSQSFLPWLDPASYELAPGGTFGDSSWTLSGGASPLPRGAAWAPARSPPPPPPS